MEEWKPIEKTNGMIEVSNEGRVRSWLRGTPNLLKTQPDTKGYHRVRVTINKEKMSFKVHREVAKAFIDNPNNLPQVNHISGDKNDNSVSNLEWITNKDNANHAVRNGLWENVFKKTMEENERRKKPIMAIRIADGTRVRFGSISDAEKKLGTRHITDVLKGKRCQCKGYTFIYLEREVMPDANLDYRRAE